MSKLTKRQLLALAAASAASPAFAQTAPAADPAATPAQPQPTPTPDSAAAAAQPVPAETAPAPTPAAAPTPPDPTAGLGKTVKVRLATPQGNIVLALAVEKAPITTANFLKYVDSKKFDKATFYRRSKPKGSTGNDYGVVQGGFHETPIEKFPAIKHESTAKTGIKHLDGTVSMGRFAPGTATSDFFICVGDQAYLDASAKDPGFAAFARVVSGMDVVKKILGMSVSPTAGSGVMKGEILARPVPITSARRI
ncbi:peptidylprolyl isomerase [Phenylobacterium deserti]|uniref:peptidylprolyl isomerase n=1 Tax=Phenylobacterium deserti TaxID=1914756 RepID=A0A328ARR6_9CAUL|nr:peptidylprolyl isomerase [Phenylobacterium deserti]RAK56951.1 peptidylprolyl isomerase [Phenylobacterium deserti]